MLDTCELSVHCVQSSTKVMLLVTSNSGDKYLTIFYNIYIISVNVEIPPDSLNNTFEFNRNIYLCKCL